MSEPVNNLHIELEKNYLSNRDIPILSVLAVSANIGGIGIGKNCPICR